MQVSGGLLRESGIDPRRWETLDLQLLDTGFEATPEQIRQSSKGRPWRGLTVWRQVGPVGDIYVSPTRAHCIMIRKSAATELVQRHGHSMAYTRWRPGESIILPAGVPSFWRSSVERDNVHIEIDPVWLQRACGGDVQVISCFGKNDPVLAGFAEVLMSSLDTNTSMQPAFGDNIAQCIALHLLENYTTLNALSTSGCSLSRRQMSDIADALASTLHEEWSTARLAALVNLSSFHFSRAFKRSFGMTPHAYITLQRMELAARIIRETRRPIFEVAEETGYLSAAHFTQVFRQCWGMTPMQYRKGY